MFPDLPMNEEDALLVEPERGEELVTISLLKQYTYCPRIVFYETCMPGVRPRTYKMLAGVDAHERERQRAARRTMSAYQVPEGERRFDVRVVSPQLQMSGLIDEVVLTPDEAIVVDYKMANWVGDNHLIQLGAYGLLAEMAFKLPVVRGFIYLLNTRRFESVAIDATLRNSVLEVLNAVQYIRFREYMPPPIDQASKCTSCEFLRFCGDIYSG